jgi:phosphatidylglycerophosphate synthase
VPSVRTGPAIGLTAQLMLLAVLAGTLGLGIAGWVVGIACGVVTNAALARGLARSGAGALGPADGVTLARATLVGGVAALVADSLGQRSPVSTLVALTAVALVLDAVDGWVARRTRTASSVGRHFDQEVDSFLILVLSVYVASSFGWWVLTIGVARYAFVVAGRPLPWLREALPPRYWGKVVAAIQGITLTVAAADVLPRSWTYAALVASLALLTESFSRSVWWLWCRRRAASGTSLAAADQSGSLPAAPEPGPARGRLRTVAAATTTVLALLLVWVALVAPNQLSRLTIGEFVRIPVEGLVVVAMALVLPGTARRVLAWMLGPALGLLVLVKLLDMGVFATLARPFNPVTDWGYLGSAVETLRGSFGATGANVAIVGAAVLAVVVLVLTTLSVLHLTRFAARHRTWSLRAVTALGLVWVLCAVLDVQLVSGTPVASTSAAGLAYDQARAVRNGVLDHAIFADEIAHDRFHDSPSDQLLTGLRGKDVIVAFVESYGRVAVQDSAFSPQVNAVLDTGTRRLQAAGFSSRSAFLTSPTFGGISWLAHATLQSGVQVDSQRRYDQLVTSDRFTLSKAFKRAGWRTVADVPSNNRDWPQGRSFYHYDQLYERHNVGYAGPTFAYASMPDQYVMSAFQRLELAAPDRAPVMAEIDLVSSHEPWTRIPRLIDWSKVGDGSVFARMPVEQVSRAALWSDRDKVRAAYGRSVRYSVNTLVSFVEHYADDNLVLVILGDHQPATIITGPDASHDVPITIVAHDKAVMDRISGWGWQDGLRPDPHAPVWPMSAFRDRFLTVYGGQPATP